MGEAQKYLRGTRLMPILPHKIGISKRILTSRAALRQTLCQFVEPRDSCCQNYG